MNSAIREKLQHIKEHYSKEGFYILGVFGSYARGEESSDSDIDILYELDDKFIKTHHGFSAFSRLAEIKDELKTAFGVDVDIAAKSGLSKTGKKYILKELESV